MQMPHSSVWSPGQALITSSDLCVIVRTPPLESVHTLMDIIPFVSVLELKLPLSLYLPLSYSLPPTQPNDTYLDYVLVCQRLVRLVVLGVLEQHLVHVRAGVLVQFVAAREDYQRDLAVAQHRQLVRLLHHAELPFVEGHLFQQHNNWG